MNDFESGHKVEDLRNKQTEQTPNDRQAAPIWPNLIF